LPSPLVSAVVGIHTPRGTFDQSLWPFGSLI